MSGSGICETEAWRLAGVVLLDLQGQNFLKEDTPSDVRVVARALIAWILLGRFPITPSDHVVQGEKGMTINELCEAAHENAVSKGFWDDHVDFGTKCALLHSEVTEAFEEHRAGRSFDEVYFNGAKPEGVAVELADLVIRVADLCGFYGIDLEAVIRMKMEYNSTRPKMHGKTC